MKQAIIHLLEVQIETMMLIRMKRSEGGPTFKRMSNNCAKLDEDLKRLKQEEFGSVKRVTDREVPGVGPILSSTVTNGVVVAIRNNSHGVPIPYAAINGVWEQIKEPAHAG